MLLIWVYDSTKANQSRSIYQQSCDRLIKLNEIMSVHTKSVIHLLHTLQTRASLLTISSCVIIVAEMGTLPKTTTN